jgi:hypothetical protein
MTTQPYSARTAHPFCWVRAVGWPAIVFVTHLGRVLRHTVGHFVVLRPQGTGGWPGWFTLTLVSVDKIYLKRSTFLWQNPNRTRWPGHIDGATCSSPYIRPALQPRFTATHTLLATFLRLC